MSKVAMLFIALLDTVTFVSILAVVTIVDLHGCNSTQPIPAAVPNRGLAAVVWCIVLDGQAVTPDDAPSDEACENCNGTGQVGDGVTMFDCDECDGTGKKKNTADETNAHANALLCVESSAVFYAAPQINWVPENNWRAEADRTGKPVLIYFTAWSGCKFCEIIKRDVFTDTKCVEDLAGFVCVKIDHPLRISDWGIGGYPQIIFVDPKSKNIVKIGPDRSSWAPIKPGLFRATLKRGYEATTSLRGKHESTNRNPDRITSGTDANRATARSSPRSCPSCGRLSELRSQRPMENHRGSR